MDGTEEVPLLSTSRRQVKWYNYVGDFFNILKAFIGTNYLSLPFAFKQSGVAFGVVGVFIIATLTDHCCTLLIKCKNYIIEDLLEEAKAVDHLSTFELTKLKQRLERTLGYGDLGKIALGKWAGVVIHIAVGFTQYLTCVCYFIFIGNAIVTIFPLQLMQLPLQNASEGNSTSDYTCVNPMEGLAAGVPMLQVPQAIGMASADVSYTVSNREIHQPYEDNITFVIAAADDFTMALPADNISSTASPQNATTASIGNITTVSPAPKRFIHISTAPDLRLLVLVPLPFFLLTSFIRRLRVISPMTVVASFALFVGALSVLGFLISGFTLIDTFYWKQFTSLPIFIGQLTSAYEGIGCVIPIQSSMEGNRHWFITFLHIAVYIVFCVLTTFGLMGYLRYGDGVQQIIILNMKQHSPLAILVDVTLIISVLFTYPLQCFPVIEIIESYLFEPGRIFGPKDHTLQAGATSTGTQDMNAMVNQEVEERQSLLSNSFEASTCSEVAIEIPQTVPTWKRNVLRVVITLSICGFAVVLRDVYAFVSAFSGAVGCSVLAFILPCMIHLRTRGDQLHRGIIIKDWIIIVLSVASSMLVIATIIIGIVDHSIQF